MIALSWSLAISRAIRPTRVNNADITFASCSSGGAWRRGEYGDRPLVGCLQLE